MKKRILQLFLLSSITLLVACKGENKDQNGENGEAATISETAVSYKADTNMSQIQWIGSKPIGKHNGTIRIKEGEFFWNDGKIEGGKFVIDMKTITALDLSGEDKLKLEGHLKGTGEKEGEDHFFNTTKFPESTFEITSVNTTDGKTMVEGNLTIKETTNSVKFPATITLNGNTLTLSSDSFKIDRTKWKVNYASKTVFEDLSDKFVDDEIELKILVIANKE